MKKLLTSLLILLIATASYAQTYTVERVIDGDKIVVTTPEGKSEKVRLIGIDAPTSQANGKAKRDSKRTGKDIATINKMGQEVTEAIKTMVKKDDKVYLEFDVQERDKYKRLLAYVWIYPFAQAKNPKFRKRMEWELADGIVDRDMLFVNATLVKSGYAMPMTIPPNVKYADLFQELFNEAFENKRGLWANRWKLEIEK